MVREWVFCGSVFYSFLKCFHRQFFIKKLFFVIFATFCNGAGLSLFLRGIGSMGFYVLTAGFA